jgi:hypothetical protein
MGTAHGQVAIRPRRVTRAYFAIFTLVWTAAILWATIRHFHGPSIAIGVVFIALGDVLCYRLSRLGAISEADGTLTIRNNLVTRRLSRGAIEKFRLSRSTRFSPRSIQVLLRDGTAYGIDVTKLIGPGQRRNIEHLEALRAWLRAPP